MQDKEAQPEPENLNTASGEPEPGLGHPDITAAKVIAPQLIPAPLRIMRFLLAFVR
jgi:hypothetical protein